MYVWVLFDQVMLASFFYANIDSFFYSMLEKLTDSLKKTIPLVSDPLTTYVSVFVI
jgi:hypothetical protein